MACNYGRDVCVFVLLTAFGRHVANLTVEWKLCQVHLASQLQGQADGKGQIIRSLNSNMVNILCTDRILYVIDPLWSIFISLFGTVTS